MRYPLEILKDIAKEKQRFWPKSPTKMTKKQTKVYRKIIDYEMEFLDAAQEYFDTVPDEDIELIWTSKKKGLETYCDGEMHMIVNNDFKVVAPYPCNCIEEDD